MRRPADDHAASADVGGAGWPPRHEPGDGRRPAAPFDQRGTDFASAFDDLFDRGWLQTSPVEADGSTVLVLTDEGRAGLARARRRVLAANDDALHGVSEDDFVATIQTLRRILGNLGGDSDLPGGPDTRDLADDGAAMS